MSGCLEKTLPKETIQYNNKVSIYSHTWNHFLFMEKSQFKVVHTKECTIQIMVAITQREFRPWSVHLGKQLNLHV